MTPNGILKVAFELSLPTDRCPRRSRCQSASRRTFRDLNPAGRTQTRNNRAAVRMPRQLRPWLDVTGGRFVCNARGPVSSIRSAWNTMRDDLDLPREATTKCIRRSMAALLIGRGVPAEQHEMQMGHRALHATTQIYVPASPAYLSAAIAGIEAILDEIEVQAPGSVSPAKHRTALPRAVCLAG